MCSALSEYILDMTLWFLSSTSACIVVYNNIQGVNSGLFDAPQRIVNLSSYSRNICKHSCKHSNISRNKRGRDHYTVLLKNLPESPRTLYVLLYFCENAAFHNIPFNRVHISTRKYTLKQWYVEHKYVEVCYIHTHLPSVV